MDSTGQLGGAGLLAAAGSLARVSLATVLLCPLIVSDPSLPPPWQRFRDSAGLTSTTFNIPSPPSRNEEDGPLVHKLYLARAKERRFPWHYAHAD